MGVDADGAEDGGVPACYINRLMAGGRISPYHNHPLNPGSLSPFKHLIPVRFKIIVIDVAVSIDNGWHGKEISCF